MKTVDRCSRVQLKNVLFATDFSPAAAAAIPFAAETAKHYGAKLYALHVRPPVINPMTPPETWNPVEEAADIEEARQRNTLLAEFPGIDPQILIQEGNLQSNLMAVIKEREIDLVVIGTHGRTGAGKFLLGSTAEGIFRQAPCPVLTIGPYAEALPKPTGEFTRILFATDFGAESAMAAPYAVSLAEEFQAHLTLLHVIAEPKVGDLVGPSEFTASSIRLLREFVPVEAQRWCVPEYVVEEGPVAETILKTAAKQKADLIVLGVRQPVGFPGAATHLPIATAHQVVCHAKCPVLTVRGS